MKTITTQEAETHLSRDLAAIERSEEFIITRGETPVAMLTPLPKPVPQKRPKVGETLGPQFSVPDSAFAPLTPEEMKEWTG